MKAAERAGRPWIEVPLAVVDLEMTGLDPSKDRICEFGVVTGRGREIDAAWSHVVRPQVPVSPGARAVHGLSDAELERAPPFADLAEGIRERLDGRVCVAHHADVDRRFLEQAFDRCGVSRPDVCWVDTLGLARILLALRSHRLASLARTLGVEPTAEHRALGDARATWGVLHALLDLVDPDAAWTVGTLCEAPESLGPGGHGAVERERILHEALERGHRLEVAYVSQDDTGRWRRTRRWVDVRHVSTRGRVRVFCHLRGAERMFRMERMHVLAVGAPGPAGVA